MPEIMSEEIVTEKPVEKKPMSVWASAIVAIAIGSSGGFYASQEIADNAMQEKIAGAKSELVEEITINEKIVDRTIDTTINGVAQTVTISDTAPEYVAPIMARFSPDIVTVETDTFVVSVTRKINGVDSMMYYGVYCPPAGRKPIFTGKFLDIQ